MTFLPMLALLSIPALFLWLALASWLRQSAHELVFYDEDEVLHERAQAWGVERCNICNRPHQHMTRFSSPYSTWDELVCDDCLAKEL